jgi:hypothetical protein
MEDERPTVGYLECDEATAKAIFADLERAAIDKVAERLIDSAAGALEGGRDATEV